MDKTAEKLAAEHGVSPKTIRRDEKKFLAVEKLRRQLNESQAAMVAAKIANLERGGDGGVVEFNAPIGALKISQGQAAELMNVSRQNVYRAASHHA